MRCRMLLSVLSLAAPASATALAASAAISLDNSPNKATSRLSARTRPRRTLPVSCTPSLPSLSSVWSMGCLRHRVSANALGGLIVDDVGLADMDRTLKMNKNTSQATAKLNAIRAPVR